MKTFSFILLFASFFIIATAQNLPETIVQHDITAVTVYLNNAEITREAQVNIPAGKSDLIFKNISTSVLEEGIKVSISNDVKVYSIGIEDELNNLMIDEELRQWDTPLDSLMSESILLNADINTLNSELKYLESNMRIATSEVSVEAIDERAKYFRDRVKALQIQLYNKRDTLQQVMQKTKEVNREKSNFLLKKEKIIAQIRVTVISEQAINSTVNLKYLVSNAVWKPYYSVRAQDDQSEIKLEYQAQIYNDTGNDWDNKKMTLAIINPAVDASKPELDAWVLERNNRKNGYKEGKLKRRKRTYGGLKDVDKEQVDVLQVDELSTRFEIEELHLIPSDAKPHLINVKEYLKPVSYFNLSIPKVKDGAYLIARIQDWETIGLIDGKVNLYYNNDYQGFSYLKTSQIGDTLELSLGSEKSFEVVRRKISSLSQKRLVGFNIKEELTYEIIVRNNKTSNASIEIRDQVPVSTSKDIEVKLIDVSGAKIDVLSGQLSWNLNLAAKETQKITMKFSVKYPKKLQGVLATDRQAIAVPRFF